MTLIRLMRAVAASLGILTVATLADAADIYSGSSMKDAPVYAAAPIWQGFYFGVNGGYGWRANNDRFSYPAGTVPGDPPIPYPAYGGIGADGGFGGGQIGYNWQGASGYSPIVIGIEADIQGAGIDKKSVDLSGEGFKTNLDWFGTVRGRIGYAADRTLIYFTGGFAFGGLRQSAEDNGFTPSVFYKSNDTVTGYVLGGGIEYKINQSWSAKAEYQYLNFGRNDPVSTTGGSASADGFKIGDDAFHTVRVGLNYHLHNDYIPLK